MNASNELTIRIDPGDHRIRLESCEDGVVACKEITKDAFYECIKRSARNEDTPSGLLPAGCFHVRINADGSKSYCLWHAALHADISYYGTEYRHFPLPRLVFDFRLNQAGKVLCCRLGVVRNERPMMDTPMYEYPFSNVSDFGLCTGNNVLPTYKNIGALSNLPGFLLSLPNNNDRFSKSRNKLGMEHRELINHLKNKDPAYYYSNVLVASGKTLQNFINGR